LERQGDKVAAERLFRESVSRSKVYLRQNPHDGSELLASGKNAIWLGRLLQDSSAAGPEKALPMFELGHRWTQAALKESPAQWTWGTAAVAELELGICEFQVRPSEHAIALVRHAAAESRRLSLHYTYPPADAAICLLVTRWAQAALIREFLRLGRAAEASEAARQMSEWLGEMAPRVSDEASLHRGLQQAQTENV
jgi:hypothetical protein